MNLRSIAGVVAVIAIGIAIGLVSARMPELALLGACVAILVAIAFIDLANILVLAFLASFFLTRVGPMSVADLALAGATVVALVVLKNRNVRALQPLLWAGAFYLALALPQLLLNRYLENYIEWGHEVLLVLGSMLVGFAIGREGKASRALTLYVLGCLALAVGAIVSNAMGDGGYVLMWHKNAVGAFLMYGAVIAFANPSWLGWRPVWAYTAFAICGAGMMSSRQALVGTLIGVLIVGMRPRHYSGKRSRWILLLLIPTAIFVYLEVLEQLAEGNRFNSASQRLTWYADSINVWMLSPIYGVGFRWWTTWHTGYGGFQPPNAELEVLTTTGIVGLIGFLGMFASVLWLLWRLNPTYGTLGFAIVAARLAQAQFDLYWVAAHASILWIVAGICYGVQERDRAEGLSRTAHEVLPLWRRTRGARI